MTLPKTIFPNSGPVRSAVGARVDVVRAVAQWHASGELEAARDVWFGGITTRRADAADPSRCR
jgi:hypothetical protein